MISPDRDKNGLRKTRQSATIGVHLHGEQDARRGQKESSGDKQRNRRPLNHSHFPRPPVNKKNVAPVEKKKYAEPMTNEQEGGGHCKLSHLFELQKKFSKRLGIDAEKFSDEDRKVWVLNYARAMQQEISELVDSLPWKWWAKYQNFDLQNAKVEIVDIFHFLISAALALGMDADDLYGKFCKKNAVNHGRQDSGYAEKISGDSRHI